MLDERREVDKRAGNTVRRTTISYDEGHFNSLATARRRAVAILCRNCRFPDRGTKRMTTWFLSVPMMPRECEKTYVTSGRGHICLLTTVLWIDKICNIAYESNLPFPQGERISSPGTVSRKVLYRN